jgi:regulator of replication initiation timing
MAKKVGTIEKEIADFTLKIREKVKENEELKEEMEKLKLN